MTAAAAVDLYLSMASWYTDLNRQRLKDMDLERLVTPAVLSYEGIQYQSMAPAVFEKAHLEYIPEPFARVPGKHPDIDQDQADDFQPEKDLAPYQHMQDYKRQDQNTQEPVLTCCRPWRSIQDCVIM